MYSCVQWANNMDLDDPSVAGSDSGVMPSQSAPSYELTVVSFSCEGGRYSKADITVRNSGATTIPFAKAFFDFTDGAGKVVATGDSYFSPNNIPPGSTASANVYASPNVDFARCRPTGIQDRDGHRATLRES